MAMELEPVCRCHNDRMAWKKYLWKVFKVKQVAATPVSYSIGMSWASMQIVTLCRFSCPHGKKEEQIFEKAFIDAIENVQTDITKLQILLGA